VNVGRQDGNQKDDQRGGRRTAGAWNQQSDPAQNFADGVNAQLPPPRNTGILDGQIRFGCGPRPQLYCIRDQPDWGCVCDV